jgi:DUF4097 and DUF4098 domain-containing protein YvlB
MGKGKIVKIYNKLFMTAVRKGTKAKNTQTHIDRKKKDKRDPSNDWRKDTVWKLDDD